MKIVFLTGSHPRHAYVARALAETGFLSGLVIEQRESFTPSPPDDIPKSTQSLFRLHFSRREGAESKFFGPASLPQVKTLNISKEELNTPGTIDFVNKMECDVVLSYGIHKLSDETLDSLKSKYKWNIHGGLSPWYRGVATHFWPSYFLEPQLTGMTVHELTKDIDGGDVIHQSAAQLVAGDGLHDLACRAVMSLTSDFSDFFSIVERHELKSPAKQKTTGRIWREQDWQPAHLEMIYDYYQDKIVDWYLEGRFENKPPKLFRQF